jgi:hypothetical protein
MRAALAVIITRKSTADTAAAAVIMASMAMVSMVMAVAAAITVMVVAITQKTRLASLKWVLLRPTATFTFLVMSA